MRRVIASHGCVCGVHLDSIAEFAIFRVKAKQYPPENDVSQNFAGCPPNILLQMQGSVVSF